MGYDRREITRLIKQLDMARKEAVEQLKQAAYFHRQVTWLQDRFPEAKLADVPGLVKLVDRKEIEAADWSLTPGRYVGVAPAEPDEDFDFEAALRDIHVELASLNEEAAELAREDSGEFRGAGGMSIISSQDNGESGQLQDLVFFQRGFDITQAQQTTGHIR